MLSHLSGRLTYANVMATLAVFIALGGTGYAALTITGKNVRNGSLTGLDLKDGSVKSGDIANGSLLSKDFKAGQLPAGLPGAQGQQGPMGQQGQKGEQGPIGPSDAYSDFAPTGDHPVVTVPAGDYTAAASGYVVNPTGTQETVTCELRALDDHSMGHAVEEYQTVPGGFDDNIAATTGARFIGWPGRMGVSPGDHIRGGLEPRRDTRRRPSLIEPSAAPLLLMARAQGATIPR